MAFNAVAKKVDLFRKNSIHAIMLIDIREPEEIERAKRAFDADTILIENDRVENVTSNDSDASIYKYRYDYIIRNNGTLDEFRNNIEGFVEEIGF